MSPFLPDRHLRFNMNALRKSHIQNQNRTTTLGIEALTTKDNGTSIHIPTSSEHWQNWISAGRTRNWMLDDPLIDWLQTYAEDRDYLPKSELPDYQRDLDFSRFIFQKGREFEEGILRLFQKQYEVVTIAENHYQMRDFEKAKGTFETMGQGAPIISQAVLWDAENLNYGSPDFLIRSDVLQRLFPDSLIASGFAPRSRLFHLALRRRRHQIHNAQVQRRSDPTRQHSQHQSLQSTTLHLQPHARTTPRVPTARILSPRPRLGIHDRS